MNFEELTEVEQNWQKHYETPEEGFKDLAIELRKAWEAQTTMNKLMNEYKNKLIKSNACAQLDSDKLENEALKQDINDKQEKIIELNTLLVSKNKNIDDLKTYIKELNLELMNMIGFDPNEKLAICLSFLVDKLSKRYDEGVKLHEENKISEHTFMHLMFGHQLTYMARLAYDLVVKDSKELREFDEQEVKENKENKERMENSTKTEEVEKEIIKEKIDDNEN